VFDFKYVPDFNVLTVRGGNEQATVKESGIERRYLNTLLITAGCLSAIGYVGIKLGSAIIGRLV
jgi:hypothetical protein